MTHFLGTHLNRLDAKGRVSVPAPFRDALRNGGDGAPVVILRPSHTYACIEAWPVAAFEALAGGLDRLDMFSEAHDDMALALYADAHALSPDKEGRIILPEALKSYAGLTDQVMFMGVGRTFQIWEPEAGARRRLDAAERARARRVTLPNSAGGVS